MCGVLKTILISVASFKKILRNFKTLFVFIRGQQLIFHSLSQDRKTMVIKIL